MQGTGRLKRTCSQLQGTVELLLYLFPVAGNREVITVLIPDEGNSEVIMYLFPVAGNSEVDLVQTHMPTVEGTTTPVIGLLIQGGPPDIDHTLALLKKKIPVILMKGFGLAADLIAFAYQEMKER